MEREKKKTVVMVASTLVLIPVSILLSFLTVLTVSIKLEVSSYNPSYFFYPTIIIFLAGIFFVRTNLDKIIDKKDSGTTIQ